MSGFFKNRQGGIRCQKVLWRGRKKQKKKNLTELPQESNGLAWLM